MNDHDCTKGAHFELVAEACQKEILKKTPAVGPCLKHRSLCTQSVATPLQINAEEEGRNRAHAVRLADAACRCHAAMGAANRVSVEKLMHREEERSNSTEDTFLPEAPLRITAEVAAQQLCSDFRLETAG